MACSMCTSTVPCATEVIQSTGWSLVVDGPRPTIGADAAATGHAILGKGAEDASRGAEHGWEERDESARVLPHDEEVDVLLGVVGGDIEALDRDELEGAPAIPAVGAASHLYMPTTPCRVEVRSHVEQVALAVLHYRKLPVELAPLRAKDLALFPTSRLQPVDDNLWFRPSQLGEVGSPRRGAADANLRAPRSPSAAVGDEHPSTLAEEGGVVREVAVGGDDADGTPKLL
eukprot:CAMPEP_0183376528 /NCGR_PEP_ID=MMETSP0164_2-20130417/120560_1 /TAXON_ID=221442 /ORGANISM="Coccolithus pelagicus ssp braarudi, Strain PLY182g" /LENGTH=229 /DNA_ID=CAMNT_0025553851 /DNA_START=478 /DNA_END=1169 /DNA_ORIENTATION=+